MDGYENSGDDGGESSMTGVYSTYEQRQDFTLTELNHAMKEIIKGNREPWRNIKKNKTRGINDKEASEWLKNNKTELQASIVTNRERVPLKDRISIYKMFLECVSYCISDKHCVSKDYEDIKKIIQSELEASSGGRRRKTNKVRKSKMRVFRRRSSKSKKSRKSRKYVR